MPRFALLIHDSPRGLHYDFFLEHGGVLRTWALPQIPQPGVEILCDTLADHRLLYLDYEGPISGDRGSVACLDRGEYSIEFWIDDRIVVDLSGAKLAGRIELQSRADKPGQWALRWEGESQRTHLAPRDVT